MKQRNINTVAPFNMSSGSLNQPNQYEYLFTDAGKEDYFNYGAPLYEASIQGDWKSAKQILDIKPDLVRYSLTEHGETALHVAASTDRNIDFVKNLVDLMEPVDLKLQNKDGNTALFLAAATGNLEMVQIMLDKNKALQNFGNVAMIPLNVDVLYGSKDAVKHLYSRWWDSYSRSYLLQRFMQSDKFDIALDLLKCHPGLARRSELLTVLAQKPEAFSKSKSSFLKGTVNSVFAFIGLNKEMQEENGSPALKLLEFLWNDIVTLPKKKIDDILRGSPDQNEPDNGVVFVAAKRGNTLFIVELIRKYPDLMWKVNDDGLTIFHIAVKHRHEGIYSLLYEIGVMKDTITRLKDKKGNNMLHLAAKTVNRKQCKNVSGALEMQRELLWFQEVKSIVPPVLREQRNSDGLTPHELFTKEHKDMVKQGEKWMKQIATQCIVVAALIATMVFAAAFTVPGGYDQNNGMPIFYSKTTFKVSVVADAISLFSSSASILYMFLSVFTARYAEQDFLDSLPKKLMVGLSYLFLSMTSMIVAFSVSFFVLYQKGLIWIPIIISVFALIPFATFVKAQILLFLDVVRSKYGSRNLFKPKKRQLYYKNPTV